MSFVAAAAAANVAVAVTAAVNAETLAFVAETVAADGAASRMHQMEKARNSSS